MHFGVVTVHKDGLLSYQDMAALASLKITMMNDNSSTLFSTPLWKPPSLGPQSSKTGKFCPSEIDIIFIGLELSLIRYGMITKEFDATMPHEMCNFWSLQCNEMTVCGFITVHV